MLSAIGCTTRSSPLAAMSIRAPGLALALVECIDEKALFIPGLAAY